MIDVYCVNFKIIVQFRFVLVSVKPTKTLNMRPLLAMKASDSWTNDSEMINFEDCSRKINFNIVILIL